MAFVEEVISSQELAGLAVSVADSTSFCSTFRILTQAGAASRGADHAA